MSQAKSFNSLQDARVAVPQHVVHRAFPTETVLLNLQTGRYHGLNPTAGRMFEMLEETGSFRDAAGRICEEFDLSFDIVERDLGELCDGLLERGLLELGRG